MSRNIQHFKELRGTLSILATRLKCGRGTAADSSKAASISIFAVSLSPLCKLKLLPPEACTHRDHEALNAT